MAYTYFIKQGSYNLFFKNIWSDFFVYQYKKSPRKRLSQNDNVTDAESIEDILAGEYMIAGSDKPMASTKWHEYWKKIYDILMFNYPENDLIYFSSDQVFDNIHNSTDSKKILKHFVSWDSRLWGSNPFYSTYRCCKPNSFSRFVKAAYILRDYKYDALPTSAIYDQMGLDCDASLSSKQNKKKLNQSAFGENLEYWSRLGLLHKEEGSRIFKWSISDLCCSDILQKIESSTLYSALTFFSSVLPFGSIGTNLMRRLGYNETAIFRGLDKKAPNIRNTMRFQTGISIGETADLFRFKHSFMSQALNDYNAIDILHAINEKRWCHIKYRHPIRLKAEAMICFPIQIKSSADDGRQYIFCFEPTTHTLSYLRLDYIESVIPIDSVSFSFFVKNKSQTGDKKKGHSKDKQKEPDLRPLSLAEKASLNAYRDSLVCKESCTDSSISSDDLSVIYGSEIENAKEWSQYCWGVSAYSKGVEVSKPQVQHIRVSLTYDPINESYIPKRVLRERRIGEITDHDTTNGLITFEVDIIDYVELCKWLQSFFCRININDIMPVDIRDRIQQNFDFARLTYSSNSFVTGTTKPNVSTFSIPEGVSFTYSDAYHEHLFNEFMSDCSEYIIYSVSAGKADTKGLYNWYYDESENSIKSLSNFCSERGNTLTHSEFYRSVLPLLTIEKRWLLSMLNSPLISLFFDENKTKELKQLISADGSIPLFTEETYQTFGQHRDIEDLCVNKEALQLYRNTFLNIKKYISEGRLIEIRYKTQHYESTKKELTGTFAPLWIEYSMRENRFRVFCYSYEDKRIYSLNLDRFVSEPKMVTNMTKELSEKFDNQPLKRADFNQIISEYYREHQTHVTVRFTDYRNTPDRILNEFSGYKKYCSKDPSSGIYTLVIWFDKSDYKDIAVRLMSYAATVLVDPDDDSGVFEDIKMRLEAQKALNDKTTIVTSTKEKD